MKNNDRMANSIVTEIQAYKNNIKLLGSEAHLRIDIAGGRL